MLLAMIRSIAVTILEAQPRPLTPGAIADAVAKALNVIPDDAQRQALDTASLVRELEASYAVYIGKVQVLDGSGAHVPWLKERRAELKWEFWKRYRKYMSAKIPETSLARLDESMDEVLARLEDPTRKGTWDRRGLVVGHVQSGKTANYTGLICKAADAGYKVIVVLAGVHDSLRSQTQIRLDEGFLGYQMLGAGKKVETGVGKLLMPVPQVDSITSRGDGDFKSTVAKNFGINPGGNALLFVVKKNVKVLSNLLNWVQSTAKNTDPSGRHYHSGVPLLMVDDEADHASVDTKEIPLDDNGDPIEDHDPTKINGLIRQLLMAFEQRAYVGFTATPFANVFIHESAKGTDYGPDLFPESFAISLATPSNYIGPARVFGTDAAPDAGLDARLGLDLVRAVEDFDVRDYAPDGAGWMPHGHKRTHQPRFKGENDLPPSLRKAIRSFVLVCAARRARGQATEHNSMLVHVSRFTDVQNKVTDQVKAELQSLKSRIKYGDGKARSVRHELQELWEADFEKVTDAMRTGDSDATPIEWSRIDSELDSAVSAIEVRVVNGSAGDALDYEAHPEGISVIAVGGDKLARGLTLEGLSVSYFLRPSTAYDTLMQMGRWFGYRPRYLDLCRLYMPPALEEWYRHIATANEELRNEFARMAQIGGTPRDFGFRVRSHPQLMVTSAAKMRTATTLNLSYSGTISETLSFSLDPVVREQNSEHCERFLGRLGPPEFDIRISGGPNKDLRWPAARLWRRVPHTNLTDFLSGLKMLEERAKKASTGLWVAYIEKMAAIGELTEWSVALLAKQGDQSVQFAGFQLLPLDRARIEDSTADGHSIRRLLDPKDESIDLAPDELARAYEQSRLKAEGNAEPDKKLDRPDAELARAQRPPERGLCLLYPIRPLDAQKRVIGDGGSVPLLGVAISFPGSARATTVAYEVNNTYWAQHFGDDAQ